MSGSILRQHGDQHRPPGWNGPTDPGGPDPLRWLTTSSPLATFRAWHFGQTIGDGLQTALVWRSYENSDASVFSPVIAGSPSRVTRVDMIPFGIYTITVALQYDLSAQWVNEITLVNDYVSIGETPYSQVFAQGVPDHVIISPTLSITKSFPVPEDIGGQNNTTINKVMRLLVYHTQNSGTGDKDLGQSYLDLSYHGFVEPGAVVDLGA